MSEENVLCSHELLIRFDQLEGNRVIWNVTVDEEVWETQTLSLIDLAECGAPLSAMGIRALWKLLLDGLMYSALEQANGIQVEVGKRLAAGLHEVIGDWEDLLGAPEGAALN
jgi:hypothetical protein